MTTSTDPDKLIAQARAKAERIMEEAGREATIRRVLADDFPHVPQPKRLFFSNGYRGNAPQVWTTWELGERRGWEGDATTRGAHFREARRILEAFDWQTIVKVKDGCTSVGPEAGTNYTEKDDVAILDCGMVLTVEGGKGYGPHCSLVAWTELPRVLNEGFIKLGVRLEHGATLALVFPAERVEMCGERVIRRWYEPARIEHAYDQIKWWATEGNYRISYLFDGPGWAAFADILQAEMGD